MPQAVGGRHRGRGAGRGLKLVALIAVGLSVAAYVEVVDATRTGPGVSHDSVDYLGAAQSIRAGHGLTLPYPSYNELPAKDFVGSPPIVVTANPPLFPALIAATSAVSSRSPLDASRVLGAIAFAVAILLVGALVWRRSRSSFWALAAMSAVLFQPDMVLISSMVWSEASTLVLMLGALLAILEYADRPSWGHLLVSAVLTAAALLDRYTAVALVPACLIAILCARPWRVARTHALAFAAIALAPILVWIIRSSSETGGVVEARHLAWHPIGFDVLSGAVQTAFRWLSPIAAARVPVLCGLLLLAGMGVVVVVRRDRAWVWSSLWLLPLFALLYLSALGVATTLFDAGLRTELASVSANYRLLSPLYVLGVISIACVAAILSRRWSDRARFGVGGVVALLCAGSVVHSTRLVSGLSQSFVYETQVWKHSPTLTLAERVPANDLLVTNSPDFVWFRTRRRSVPVPRLYSELSKSANVAYGTEIAAIRQAVLRGKSGWLVYWNDVSRPYLPSLAQLDAELRLRTVATTSDGGVFRIEPRISSSAR